MTEETNKNLDALQHILEQMKRAEQFMQGKSLVDLEDDAMLRYAVVKCMESIGESAETLSPAFKDVHSEIPWDTMIAMRQVYSQRYYSVKLPDICDFIKNDFGTILPWIEQHIEEEKKKPNFRYSVKIEPVSQQKQQPAHEEFQRKEQDSLSEEELMRKERERLFEQERIRKLYELTHPKEWQLNQTSQSTRMPHSSHKPNSTNTQEKPKQTETRKRPVKHTEYQETQERERSIFVILWLLAMVGYFGYLLVDAAIPFIRHFDDIKHMDIDSVLLVLIPILIFLEFFIGSVKLLFWRRSGIGRLVFAAILLVGLVIYFMVKYHCPIDALPSGLIRDIITAILCPIVTYSILQIPSNGKSCWSWMD